MIGTPNLLLFKATRECWMDGSKTPRYLDRKSHIRHSRTKVLGGCSSHNTLIFSRPLDLDMAAWESLGAHDWDFATMDAADR